MTGFLRDGRRRWLSAISIVIGYKNLAFGWDLLLSSETTQPHLHTLTLSQLVMVSDNRSAVDLVSSRDLYDAWQQGLCVHLLSTPGVCARLCPDSLDPMDYM